MARIVFVSEKNKERYLRIVEPLGTLFARLGVHPNILSISGLILSIVAGVVYSTGNFLVGGCVAILAGTCDVLDGLLARKTGKASRFGAFFDSTLDRFGEVVMFAGLAWYFAGGDSPLPMLSPSGAGEGSPWAVVFIILAIAGAFMVSYTRARAEGLGVECKVGMMQRPERFTLLILGSLLGGLPVMGRFIMELTLFLLALTANITAIYRMVHVRNQLRGEEGAT